MKVFYRFDLLNKSNFSFFCVLVFYGLWFRCVKNELQYWKLCSAYASMRECEFIACIQITHEIQHTRAHIHVSPKKVGEDENYKEYTYIFWFNAEVARFLYFMISLCASHSFPLLSSINSSSSFIMHATHMCSYETVWMIRMTTTYTNTVRVCVSTAYWA